AAQYRKGVYSEQIKLALNYSTKIRDILNAHRTSPLEESYLPVSIYCEKCNTDHKVTLHNWDGEVLSYDCQNCNHNGEVKYTSPNIKLPWRIDWAMRWAF